MAAGAAPAASGGWEVVHTTGEVDVVVVNELSRLTRKGAHDALEIDKEFSNYGERFPVR